MTAASFTKQRSANYSSGTAKLFSFVPSTSYPANGEPVTPANVGLNGPIDMILFGPAINAGGFVLMAAYDPVLGTIRLFLPTGGAAVAPSTIVAPLVQTGASTASAVSATTPGLTPGGGKEAATTTDLSGFTIYGLAFGNN